MGTCKIIISLTSYPKRIAFVPQVIDSLLNQTYKADKVILWLAKSQFLTREEELPKELLAYIEKGLAIEWCDEDIRGHKKYFYAMQQYPEDIIITVDDDCIYDSDLVETLYASYRKYPQSVSTTRTNQMIFSDTRVLNKYTQWKLNSKEFVNIESLSLVAIGVGGVLYPPHCMHDELFNIKQIKSTCLNADDLWLKVMQLMCSTKVVLARWEQQNAYEIISESQESALQDTNIGNGENDIQLQKILKEYNHYFGSDPSLLDKVYGDFIHLPELLRRKEELVYSWLGDAVSQQVYRTRLEYNKSVNQPNLTLDWVSCATKTVVEKMTHVDRIEEGDTIIIYGAKKVGERYYRHLSTKYDYVTFLFCDKGYEEIRDWCGVEVISPEKLFAEYGNCKVIIGSTIWYDEIATYLTSNGVCKIVNKRVEDLTQRFIDPILNLSGDEIDTNTTYTKLDVADGSIAELKKIYKTIQMNKPKLAISISRNPSDLLEIPCYIKELVPEYQLYLRHYSNYERGSVLYAVL